MFYNRCMSRKNRSKDAVRRKSFLQPAQGGGGAGIGGWGLAGLAAALALICGGYFLLKRTDPAGENIFAILAPVFLLAGYLLVPAVLLSFQSPVKTEDKEAGLAPRPVLRRGDRRA